jgi:pSer/pThr/pTyr-binding forkhead associated (FHA) protein
VACLVWERSDGSRVEFPLEKGPLVVGRDEAADICIAEPLVSRTHARIERRQEDYFIVDLASTNLTRVNGAAVTEQPLRDGDEIRFARARCFFRDSNGAGG